MYPKAMEDGLRPGGWCQDWREFTRSVHGLVMR
jgi:hypothetical protein